MSDATILQVDEFRRDRLRLDGETRAAMNAFERSVRTQIRGQDEAVDAIVSAVLRAHARPDRRPGRFLLLGPTGVGKTAIVSAVARFWYGSYAAVDCSGLDSPAAMAGRLEKQLQPAPDGIVRILPSVRKFSRPRGVVLLDEFEKASPQARDLGHQILEPGRLTSTDGRVLDFSRHFIFCTGNIAGAELLGLESSIHTTIEQHVYARARDRLRPELFNRFDEILVFKPLEFEHQKEILESLLRDYIYELHQCGYWLSVEPSVIQFLMGVGFDRDLGARPLIRAIDRYVDNAVLHDLRYHDGDSGVLEVNAKRNGLIVTRNSANGGQEKQLRLIL